jgi:hypothetical protein
MKSIETTLWKLIETRQQSKQEKIWANHLYIYDSFMDNILLNKLTQI